MSRRVASLERNGKLEAKKNQRFHSTLVSCGDCYMEGKKACRERGVKKSKRGTNLSKIGRGGELQFENDAFIKRNSREIEKGRSTASGAEGGGNLLTKRCGSRG